MRASMAFLYHLFLLSLLLPVCFSADSIGTFCDKSFKGGSTKANIDRVLADLVARASVGGFAVSSSGKGSDIVYGLAQCRGDVSDADCAACIADAAKKLPTDCPGDADARIWYDYCFLRYDTDNFVGTSDTGNGVILINVENATDPEAFDREVGRVMSKVEAQAVAPGSGGLGRVKSAFTPYVTIYGLAQCTRDLQPLSCAQCISSAVGKFAEYCQYRKGCQVNYSSCRARYEIYPFFFPLDSTSQSSAAAAAAAAAAAKEGSYTKAILYPTN